MELSPRRLLVRAKLQALSRTRCRVDVFRDDLDVDAIIFPGSGTVNAFSQSTTAFGWTIGGGVEFAFDPNWSVKAEYLYVDMPERASLV
jgi:opacity protein-like surface antigen